MAKTAGTANISDPETTRKAGIVVRVVARYYGINPRELRTKNRECDIATAKLMCYYLLSTEINLPLSHIGRFMAKDKDTVAKGYRRAELLLQSNHVFMSDRKKILTLLYPSRSRAA